MQSAYSVSRGKGRKAAPVKVILQVYDLVPNNGWLYNIGMGLHHTGIELFGQEFAFFGGEGGGTGVMSTPPGCGITPPGVWREAIVLGQVRMTSTEIKRIIDEVSDEFPANSYDTVSRNCNDFSNALCLRLLGKPIPAWVNRLAKTGGSLVKNLIPSTAPPGASPVSSCKPSKGKTKAFTGEGRALGGSSSLPTPDRVSSGAASISSATGGLVDEHIEAKEVEVDESKPTTKLQVRLPDGDSLTLVLNQAHTIRDLYAAIKSKGIMVYPLFTAYPRRKLDHTSDETLKAQELLNCALKMEIPV